MTGRVGKNTFWFVSQVQFLPSRFGLSDVRTGLKCVSLWFQTSTWYENSAAGVSPSLFRLIADLTTNYLRHVISLEFQVSVQKIYKNSANLLFFFQAKHNYKHLGHQGMDYCTFHWSIWAEATIGGACATPADAPTPNVGSHRCDPFGDPCGYRMLESEGFSQTQDDTETIWNLWCHFCSINCSLSHSWIRGI